MKTCKLKFVLLKQQFTLIKTKEQEKLMHKQDCLHNTVNPYRLSFGATLSKNAVTL